MTINVKSNKLVECLEDLELLADGDIVEFKMRGYEG